jgi:hypothetical protein
MTWRLLTLQRILGESRQPVKRPHFFIPAIEQLEGRLLLAQFTWTGKESQDMAAAANWLKGGKATISLPGSDDDLIFDKTGAGNPATLESVKTTIYKTMTIEAAYDSTVTIRSEVS